MIILRIWPKPIMITLCLSSIYPIISNNSHDVPWPPIMNSYYFSHAL